ncbi:MAG: glycerol kinase GlpK [bacterium]|nr:glycerol kinase GlpK [bacterium]
MRAILALDQGTTSSRAILCDRDSRILGVAQQEFGQHFPRPGWVEHDAEEIWTSQLAVAQRVLRESGVDAAEVAALGITNQRETTLVWDRGSGRPIHNAIVWQDRRTADRCEELKAQGVEQLVTARTGLVLDPYFSATKVAYILDHVDGARDRAKRGELAFGTVDAWLLYRLTGGRVHATDATNAARTLLFDIGRGVWDDELCELFGVPRAMLPQVVPSSGRIADSDPALLGAAVPIAGIAGDQHAALFGQTCFTPGVAKTTYGTGCFLLSLVGDTPRPSRNGLLSTVAWQIGERTEYALEGSVFVGGAVVQWLRDGLGLIRDSAEVESLAGSVPDNGGVYFVPAFVGLGAPHWDPHARGTITGLTRGTEAGHVARAALEGIAYQVRDVLDGMQQDAGSELTEMRVDGGACANDLLMQFQADILGIPVVRPQVVETTALGAAYLAGLAVSFWQDRDALRSLWREDRRYEPQMSADEVAHKLKRWRDALARARGWDSGTA